MSLRIPALEKSSSNFEIDSTQNSSSMKRSRSSNEVKLQVKKDISFGDLDKKQAFDENLDVEDLKPTEAISNELDEPEDKINEHLPQTRTGLGSGLNEMIDYVKQYYGKIILIALVWLVGYMRFSPILFLLGIFFYIYREMLMSNRLSKLDMIRNLAINEKKTILARVDEVPSWVFFPDRERAEWINKMIKIIWPYFVPYLERVIKEKVEPLVNQYSLSFLDQIKIKEIDMGDIAPRVGGIKVYTENVDNNEIILDVELLYAGDAQLKLKAKKLIAGVKDISLHCETRVIFKPICSRMPFLGAMQFFLLRQPEFNFNLTEAANSFDLPGLRSLIDVTLHDVIAKTLVFPNRFVMPIIPDFDVSEIEICKPLSPHGVLRVQVISASRLRNADIGFFGKSDPYVKISGHGLPQKTRVIKDNLNPFWNETFHFMFDKADINTKLFIEVMDEDDVNDDFLGSLTFAVDDLITRGIEENEYRLQNTTHGHLRLRFDWFHLSSKREKLTELKQSPKSNISGSSVTSVLLITLKSAHDLPRTYKQSSGNVEPNPRVQFEIGNQRIVSSVKMRTTNPKWNENHSFFLENPETEKLACFIEDEKSKKIIASMTFSLSELLDDDEMSIERTFVLNTKESSYRSKLILLLTLKIFSPTSDDELIVANPDNLSASGYLNTQPDENSGSDASSFHQLPKENSVQSHSNLKRTRSNLNGSLLDSISSAISTNLLHHRHDYGKIHLSMKYVLAENRLFLTIHECRNLKLLNKLLFPNPFVKLCILPDETTKMKTQFKKENTNPVFNERFDWNIDFNALRTKQLLLTVRNEKSFYICEPGFLGQVLIDLSHIDINISYNKWFNLRGRDESKLVIDKFE